MSLDQDIALLARVGLFQSFSSDQLRLLAFGAVREDVQQGGILFHEGEAAQGGYIVARGQIDLMLQKGKRQVVLDTAMEGGLIGETALLAEGKRPADAVARNDSEVLFISQSLFRRMLSEYPEAAATLHGRIAQSVRRMMTQIERVHGQLEKIRPLSEIAGLADTAQAELEAPEGSGAEPNGPEDTSPQ